ncbi:MAG: alpha/beta fold hydrolase, partial [Aquidulcibacter sp.]|nr:alpha/beta fold hydrolase [Aquidulcibacter sp.]
MLLIQGSGPTDRNGNQLPFVRTDLLAQLATDLTARGYVTLRYDKRGMKAGRLTLPRDPVELKNFVAWSNFVGDARYALNYLAQNPNVDPKRIYVIGHSEGGLITLDLVQDRTLPIKGAVILATPARPAQVLVREQVSNLMREQGAGAAQIATTLAAMARLDNAIFATGNVPEDVPRELGPLYE